MVLKAGLLALVAAFSLSDSVHNISPDNFNERVLKNPLPVVVDFYAEWCSPCPEMKSYFNEICGKNSGVYCGGFDVDQDETLPPKYGVDALPAFRFFCNGKEDESRRMEGSMPKEQLETAILDFIDYCS